MTQFRMSLLYCAAAMSGAFSGLLAAGIAEMRGMRGYAGWLFNFVDLNEGLIYVRLGVDLHHRGLSDNRPWTGVILALARLS